MHIATKTNETNTKSKSFKKVKCRCNGKVIIIHFQVFYILLYTYRLEQIKNVPTRKCPNTD